MPNLVGLKKRNKIVCSYPDNLNKIIALRVINYSNFVFPVLPGFSHKRTKEQDVKKSLLLDLPQSQRVEKSARVSTAERGV